jgi:hypothetical protein
MSDLDRGQNMPRHRRQNESDDVRADSGADMVAKVRGKACCPALPVCLMTPIWPNKRIMPKPLPIRTSDGKIAACLRRRRATNHHTMLSTTACSRSTSRSAG